MVCFVGNIALIRQQRSHRQSLEEFCAEQDLEVDGTKLRLAFVKAPALLESMVKDLEARVDEALPRTVLVEYSKVYHKKRLLVITFVVSGLLWFGLGILEIVRTHY